MATISASRAFDAPPDVVWAVVTDPDVYAAVAPNLTAVELLDAPGEEMVRRCVDTGGNAWTESATHWDERRAFGVRVGVANSEFHRRLFTRFEGQWRVEERGSGVVVTIQFDYDTRYGPLGRLVSAYVRYRAPSLLDAIFDGWAAEVAARLYGSRSTRSDPEATAEDADQPDPGDHAAPRRV